MSWVFSDCNGSDFIFPFFSDLGSKQSKVIICVSWVDNLKIDRIVCLL